MNEYEYKIDFFDEDGNLLETEYLTATGETEDFARDKAYEYANEQVDESDFAYADFDITLVDAH